MIVRHHFYTLISTYRKCQNATSKRGFNLFMIHLKKNKAMLIVFYWSGVLITQTRIKYTGFLQAAGIESHPTYDIIKQKLAFCLEPSCFTLEQLGKNTASYKLIKQREENHHWYNWPMFSANTTLVTGLSKIARDVLLLLQHVQCTKRAQAYHHQLHSDLLTQATFSIHSDLKLY